MGRHKDQRRHSVSESRRWKGVKRDSGDLGNEEAKDGRVSRVMQSDESVSEVREADNDKWDQVRMGTVARGDE